MSRATIEAVADRWQRRHTGPWITVEDRVGPVVVTRRYRRRRRIEYVRLDVALHRAWKPLAVAFLRRLVLPLARILGG